MTDLQEEILLLIREKINNAYSLIMKEPTNPQEACRVGTHSSIVLTNIRDAEKWLRLLSEDENE